jgi:hypothetical protein
MRPDAPREADRPLGELLRELGDEISVLVRQEIALAKVEIAERRSPPSRRPGCSAARRCSRSARSAR